VIGATQQVAPFTFKGEATYTSEYTENLASVGTDG